MQKLNELACEISAISFTIVNLKKKLNWILNDKERYETRQKLQVKQNELKQLHQQFNLQINELLCWPQWQEKKSYKH